MKISDPKDRGVPYPLKNLIKDIWQKSGNKKENLIYGTILRILGDTAQLYPAYGIALLITILTSKTATTQNVLVIIFLCILAYILRYTC